MGSLNLIWTSFSCIILEAATGGVLKFAKFLREPFSKNIGKQRLLVFKMILNWSLKWSNFMPFVFLISLMFLGGVEKIRVQNWLSREEQSSLINLLKYQFNPLIYFDKDCPKLFSQFLWIFFRFKFWKNCNIPHELRYISYLLFCVC